MSIGLEKPSSVAAPAKALGPLRERWTSAVERVRGRDADWRHTVRLMTLLVLLPFAAMLYLKLKFGFYGPAVNTDLLLVYLVSGLLSRAIGMSVPFLATLGLLFVFAVQIFIGVGLIFVFDPLLLLDYFSFIRGWPWRMVGAGAALVALAFGAVYLSLRRVEFRRAHLAPAVALLVLILGTDLWARTPAGYAIVGQNVATSSAKTVLNLVRTAGAHQAFHYVPQPGPSMASDVLSEATPPPRILSVSVEAYGLGSDPAFNDAIARRLTDAVAGAYDVERTTHAFKGLTIEGEFRELCGVRIAVSPKRADAEALRGRCLPYELARRGYVTSGLHGNTGFFYMRDQLYPAIGFERRLFHPEIRADGGVDCPSRSFPGICDRDVMRVALASFGKAPREFVHVMTLDTHFPYFSKTPGDRDCAGMGRVRTPDLCMYGHQFADALGVIGRAIAAAPVKPDVIYVYGDHAPPYIDASLRGFFNREQVPVFVLRRRDAAAAS